MTQAIHMLRKYFEVIKKGFRTIEDQKKVLASYSFNEFRQIYGQLK